MHFRRLTPEVKTGYAHNLHVTRSEPDNLLARLHSQGPVIPRNSYGIDRFARVHFFQMEAGMMRVLDELAVGLTCLALYVWS